MKNMPFSHNNEKGFTLIEALVAMVVLTIGVFALYSMQVAAIRGNAKSNSISLASNIAAVHIENVISLEFDDITKLKDKNGDGVAGLDNVDGLADYTITQPNKNYSVFYNVAPDALVPAPAGQKPFMKVVQIIVRDNSKIMSNTVSYQYIKNDNI